MATPSTYAHYKCNDDAANTVVTDDGSGANNGVGNVNTSNYSVIGKINDAFEFNGSSEYINLDTLEVDIDSDTTGSITFWVSATSLAGVMFGLGDTDGENYFQIGITDSAFFASIVDSVSGAARWTLKSGTITTATWYHLVITYDGTSAKMYLDGTDVTNFTVNTDLTFWFSDIETALDNGRLAALNAIGLGNINFFEGKIDDFRYYQNQTLAQEDVSNLYRGGVGTESDPPDYYSAGFAFSQGCIIT